MACIVVCPAAAWCLCEYREHIGAPVLERIESTAKAGRITVAAGGIAAYPIGLLGHYGPATTLGPQAQLTQLRLRVLAVALRAAPRVQDGAQSLAETLIANRGVFSSDSHRSCTVADIIRFRHAPLVCEGAFVLSTRRQEIASAPMHTSGVTR